MIGPERQKAIRELARLLNVEHNLIVNALGMLKNGTAYKVWSRPKRPGSAEKREIQNPQWNLRKIQTKIAGIISPFAVSEINHSYIAGRYPLTALLPHLYSNTFFSFDIKNAFPSVKRKQIKLSFQRLSPEFQKIKIDFTEEVADLMAELSCYSPTGKPKHAFLPQGLACSPYIFNLVLKDIDRVLANFAKKRGYQITRYSDDFLLSTTKETIPAQDREIAIKLIESLSLGNFRIPAEKTNYKETKSEEVHFEFLGLAIEGSRDGERIIGKANEKLFEFKFFILDAIAARDFSEKTFRSIKGKIGHLKSIYQVRPLPEEVAEPYSRYRSLRDG